MAQAYNFLIGGNDEHGVNPPTAGKRTPILPNIERSFYENEFNRQAKYRFLEACLRCGFNVFDVKPELQDISITTRLRRINSAGLTLLVTFAYNAFGTGTNFNSANGFEIFYSRLNPFSNDSRVLSEEIYEELSNSLPIRGLGVNTLNVSVLSSVNCPSTLVEAGFMTNFDEAKLMLDPDYVLLVAENSCKGVCNYLDVEYLPRNDLNAYPTLSKGSRGNKVRLLQLVLNGFGYNLTPDGIFGNNTYTAVANFQQRNGLVQDGIVGRNSWNALLNINPSSKTIRKGARSSNVEYLQRKLLSKLYPINSIDSIWGNETENAVRAFQRENGLVVDGIVGPLTWEKISQLGGGRQLNWYFKLLINKN